MSEERHSFTGTCPMCGQQDCREVIERLRALNTQLYTALDQALTWLPSGFAPQSQANAMKLADAAIEKYKVEHSHD